MKILFSIAENTFHIHSMETDLKTGGVSRQNYKLFGKDRYYDAGL